MTKHEWEAALLRDHARTEAILRRQDEFLAEVRRLLRDGPPPPSVQRRLRALARSCTRECRAIVATYETTDIHA